MPSATECDVLVVGAGVGGAALTLALAVQFPLRVIAVDRRSGPGNINRGDSLLPAVTRHLRTWGALPSFYAAGARPVAKMQVFHPTSGLLFEGSLTPTLDDEAAPYLVLPHPAIERTLVERARATGRAEVHYNQRVIRLISEDSGGLPRIVGAVVQTEDGEKELRARVVVGADGATSTVRSGLGIDLNLIPYDHGFYIAEMERPRNYEDAMRIELHPDGNILVVPQGPDRVGIGVLVRNADQTLFRAGSQMAKFEAIGRRSQLLAGLQPFTKGAHLYSLSRGHAKQYVAAGAALIGDAVHITNPTAGQGMTMAIEDAASLAMHLGPSITAAVSRSVLDERLLGYQRDRWPKNESQIRWSHWLSRFYALPGSTGHAIHHHVFRIGSSPLGRLIQNQIWLRMATRPRRDA